MASPAPTPTPKKVPVKGKPMGIPMWGWVIAAVIGIVIGYTILKKSGSGVGGSVSASGADSGSGIAGEEEGSSGGGSIVLPLEDILSALGLRGGSAVEPSPSTQESSSIEQAMASAEQGSISDPIIQEGTGFGTTPEGAGWLGAQANGMSWDQYLASLVASEQANPYSSGLGPSPYVDYSVINDYFTNNPSSVLMPGSIPVSPVTPISENQPTQNVIPGGPFVAV